LAQQIENAKSELERLRKEKRTEQEREWDKEVKPILDKIPATILSSNGSFFDLTELPQDDFFRGTDGPYIKSDTMVRHLADILLSLNMSFKPIAHAGTVHLMVWF
jgi:hypothetical protein